MTGGGVYPALAVLQALGNKAESTLWIGSQSGLEKALLTPLNIDYQSIPAGGIHGVSLKKMPKNILDLINGYRAAKTILRQFKPDVVFYTGGYLGVPMALAARNIPSVVFIPDIEPGLALKIITRYADRIAVSTNQSIKYFKDETKTKVTGYPLREEIKKWTRVQSKKYFNIKNSEKVLLVFGGSKGALSINNALISNLEKLTQEMHVIHITGIANWKETQKKTKSLQLGSSNRYHPYPFLHTEMGAALAASDLVVCRAGASTIGELPHFGLPAILVPYPHAWHYQHQNAAYIAESGGAIILEDANISDSLYLKIISLFRDSDKLKEMSRKIKNIAIEDAATTIARIVSEVGSRKNGGKVL